MTTTPGQAKTTNPSMGTRWKLLQGEGSRHIGRCSERRVRRAERTQRNHLDRNSVGTNCDDGGVRRCSERRVRRVRRAQRTQRNRHDRNSVGIRRQRNCRVTAADSQRPTNQPTNRHSGHPKQPTNQPTDIATDPIATNSERLTDIATNQQ